MRIIRAVAKSCVTTAIFFLLAELLVRAAYFGRNSLVHYIPLPYVVGDEYGPIPPWLDNLLILRSDDALIWTNIPNAERAYVDIFAPVWSDDERVALLRRFVPWLPTAFRSNPVWRIALNGDGYRSAPMARAKRSGAVRIACIGDSWTFGMNVNQDQTYPSRLEAYLRNREPSADFDVMNFGVLGYSSFQGLQLLKLRVLDFRPDVLVIGFGMNDSEVAGYRDRDMVQPGQPDWHDRVKAVADSSEVYKLLQYTALRLRFRPKSMGDYLKADAASDSNHEDATDYDDIEPWTRVSPKDYEKNLREMIGLARAAGARVVLVDNELWPESPYRAVLSRVAADERLALVDSLRMVMDAKSRVERDLESRLALEPAVEAAGQAQGAPNARQTIVFRVFEGNYPVARALSIVGTDPQLGAAVPNTILMHDDGDAGDERAHDRVWSYRATFPVGARIRYVFTNSGREGRWEGLDVPHIREVVVPAAPGGKPVYLPIESFGKIYMQADNWHTDAVGYDLIAKAVADAIETQSQPPPSSQAPQPRQP